MWGRNTLIISSLSPKRDRGPKIIMFISLVPQVLKRSGYISVRPYTVVPTPQRSRPSEVARVLQGLYAGLGSRYLVGNTCTAAAPYMLAYHAVDHACLVDYRLIAYSWRRFALHAFPSALYPLPTPCTYLSTRWHCGDRFGPLFPRFRRLSVPVTPRSGFFSSR